MSEKDEKKPGAPEAAPGKKKSSSSPGIVGILLPALLAGGASFGGAKFAIQRATLHVITVEKPAVAEEPVKPPGPTIALEPFLVATTDANRKSHAMKMTLAIEFDEHTKEESTKTFIPRIRDATLTHLRTLMFEDLNDSAKTDRLRTELLEKFKATGATTVQKVLITDLVLQ